MVDFKIKIAGRIIEVRTQTGYTRELCRDFLIQENADETKPDLVIEITDEDIKSEIESGSGVAESQSDIGDTESLLLYRGVAKGLLRYGTLLVHSSSISFKGKGILFTASSGTGKSTHVSYWSKLYPDDMFVVNDDKPLIRTQDDGKCFISSSPWAGKENRYTNIETELKAVCFICRSDDNYIKPLSVSDALPRMMQFTLRPCNKEEMDQAMGVLGNIMAGTKFYELGCKYDESAAVYAHDYLEKDL